MGEGEREETPASLQGMEDLLGVSHQSCTRRQVQGTKCKTGISYLLSLSDCLAEVWRTENVQRISCPLLETHK